MNGEAVHGLVHTEVVELLLKVHVFVSLLLSIFRTSEEACQHGLSFLSSERQQSDHLHNPLRKHLDKDRPRQEEQLPEQDGPMLQEAQEGENAGEVQIIDRKVSIFLLISPPCVLHR